MRKLLFDSLLPLLAQQRPLAVSFVLCGFLASMTEGIGISLFVPLFNALEPGLAATGTSPKAIQVVTDLFAGVPDNVRVGAIAAMIFCAVLAKGLLAYLATYQSTLVAARTTLSLRSSIVDVVLGGSPGTLARLGHGRVMNVLSHESWKAGDAAALSLQIVVTSFQLLVYLGILMLISWQLTLVVAALLGSIGIIARFVTRRLRDLSTSMTRSNAEVSRKMIDMVGGADVIRGFGTKEREQREFQAASRQLARQSVQTWSLTGMISPLYEVIAAAVIVGVLLSTTRTNAGIAPQLVFAFVFLRLVPVVRRLERERAELLAAGGPVRETLDVIGAAAGPGVESGTTPFRSIQERIVLENVSYKYEPGTAPALDDISLDIPARGLTALVGPSGAGKSTLGRLILRLLDPTAGRILVDGTPYAELELASWRNSVAVVPQKPFLFNATVRDNIAYGTPNASDDEIVNAAKAAGAHEIVEKLSDGYQTKLGEAGIELSGGEAQRICLARAIIKKPELVLLDEATNALDSISEARVRQALESVKTGCCVVVIAHRLETVSNADRIVVLDKGRVVEQGTLQTLLERDGMFSRMYRASCRPDTSA